MSESKESSKPRFGGYDHNYESKFTNRQNSYYINKLFIEFSNDRDPVTIYSLGPKDHKNPKYTNLHKAYLEMEDVTEWNFANKYFANWDHWVMICNSSTLKPYVEKWRKELEIKLRSRALQEIIMVAQDGGNRSFEANKFLVGSGWMSQDEKKEAAKRGRPTKESIKSQAVREFIEDGERIESDLKRLEEYRGRKSDTSTSNKVS